MPLETVIDARRLRDFGIGTYIRNLTRALARQDNGNRYTLVVRPDDAAEAAGLGPNFRVVPYARPEADLLHNVTFPRFLRGFKANLYHIPLNYVAWWMPQPYVLTIHDMSTLLFPAHHELRNTLHEQRFRRGAARARRVIAVSESTRRDVESVLHVPPERIRVIYSAPDPAFTADGHDPALDRQILERYSIALPFVLYAGAIRTQKNVARLVEAFAVVRYELENHPVYRDLKLVIIGDELSKYPSLRRAVRETRVEQSVRFLGFVPSETLQVFYRAASAFAFPSLYEGFGLAPLEAMSCGTPVVASNIPALVEAAGDAAELVSPDNVFDIARGLRTVLVDEDRRNELASAGRERARRFDWDQTARAVLAVYDEAAASKNYH
jgi:glycosyltransferase involved in cell wall biosynthesis